MYTFLYHWSGFTELMRSFVINVTPSQSIRLSQGGEVGEGMEGRVGGGGGGGMGGREEGREGKWGGGGGNPCVFCSGGGHLTLRTLK